jgi:hypothetical protein
MLRRRGSSLRWRRERASTLYACDVRSGCRLARPAGRTVRRLEHRVLFISAFGTVFGLADRLVEPSTRHRGRRRTRACPARTARISDDDRAIGIGRAAIGIRRARCVRRSRCRHGHGRAAPEDQNVEYEYLKRAAHPSAHCCMVPGRRRLVPASVTLCITAGEPFLTAVQVSDPCSCERSRSVLIAH